MTEPNPENTKLSPDQPGLRDDALDGSGKIVVKAVLDSPKWLEKYDEIGTVEGYGAIAYQKHLDWLAKYLPEGEVPYPFDRNLEGKGSYMDNLPSILKRDEDGNLTGESSTFVDVIDELIKERKEEAKKTELPFNPPTVMDIGPGNCQALLDARSKWGDNIKLIGVGPDVFLDFDGTNRSGRHIAPTRNAVEKAGIDLINDSVTNLDKALPEGSEPDVILSSHAMQYTDTPLWETFASQIYKKLKPGGFAFIAAGPPHISEGVSVFAELPSHFAHSWVTSAMNKRYKEDLGKLNDYLRALGYHFDINADEGQLACQKTEINGGFDLPAGINTMLELSVEDLGLEEKAAENNYVEYWCQNMVKKYPRSLSAYPVMDILA